MRNAAFALGAALLGLAAQAPWAGADEDRAAGDHAAEWYVLRQPDSFQCRVARVIQVDGTLATGSAAIAGGPFESREQAEEHIARLAERATCRSG